MRSLVPPLLLLASVAAMAKSPVRFLGPPEKKPSADGGTPDAAPLQGPHETPALEGTVQSTKAEVSAGTTDAPILKPGDPAPAFTAAVRNPGEAGLTSLSLRSLVGSQAGSPAKAVVLSFFATWCQPCRQELPLLQRLSTEYRSRGLRVVSVALDPDEAAQPAIHALVAQHHLTFPIVNDRSNLIARKYLGERNTLPSVFIIKADGAIALVKQGYPNDAAEFLEAEVEKALAAP
jgi:peroxiredoxin